MPTKRLASILALFFCLTATASASATTYHAAPNSTRAAAPCTESAPCKLTFALDQSFNGDEVVLAAGTYDFQGTDPVSARPGVVVHGAPGRTRPLIEQTVPYGDCDGCPILNLNGDATLRDVDVAQRTEGGGAVRATAEATIERSALRGRAVALRLNGGLGQSGSVRDVLAVAVAGTAIVSDGGGPVRRLENVTAIGLGNLSVGIRATGAAGVDNTVDAVNSIVRGEHLDVQSHAGPTAGFEDVTTVKLRYSNFRLDRIEKVESDPAWSNAQVETFDNNQHDAPRFASATDFRQATGSPTIDNGRVAGLLGALDLDGTPRTFGAKPDIGAYEWAADRYAAERRTGDGGRGTDDGKTADGRTAAPTGPEPPVSPQQPVEPPAPGRAVLARQTVTVKKNVAAIAVRCEGASACTGTLAVTSAKVKVGSAKYNVAAGKRVVVRVKLSRAARRVIARKRKLKTTATAQGSKAPVTLKLPARRR